MKKVDRVTVACQTELEPEKTEVSEASWGVAQLKAKLEQEMEAHNNSSGYGSDISLDDEESLKDTSSDSGVELFTSSPCKGLSSVCESSQLVTSLAEEEQEEE